MIFNCDASFDPTVIKEIKQCDPANPKIGEPPTIEESLPPSTKLRTIKLLVYLAYPLTCINVYPHQPHPPNKNH